MPLPNSGSIAQQETDPPAPRKDELDTTHCHNLYRFCRPRTRLNTDRGRTWEQARADNVNCSSTSLLGNQSRESALRRGKGEESWEKQGCKYIQGEKLQMEPLKITNWNECEVMEWKEAI